MEPDELVKEMFDLKSDNQVRLQGSKYIGPAVYENPTLFQDDMVWTPKEQTIVLFFPAYLFHTAAGRADQAAFSVANLYHAKSYQPRPIDLD